MNTRNLVYNLTFSEMNFPTFLGRYLSLNCNYNALMDNFTFIRHAF